MLDPILRLALAIHSSKGVYALLLGSGVSRSSAIPTGWEVVVDLIRKLAVLKSESCDPDPEAWYKALTGTDPDYSDILDQVTSSSAERGQLLRSYFEPSEEDREQGRKAPSPAHRAIARLVAKGYIRVIVTTNFDRLMEQALVDEGVQPTVISTTDAVQGAMPLTHSPCMVVKVHGDYLDHRLRNTKAELSAYEKPFDDLLDRVFDEFGLVISGWSAGWDMALCAALERCSTHRFGTFWTARGTLTGEAEKVISVRRATVVPIKDADTFFTDLAEKIRALEDMEVADPISARVAVARMKRHLADPQQRINLHDLVRAETERVYSGVRTDRFSLHDNDISPESVLRRLRAYEAELQTLIAILGCGGYWATDNAQRSSICGAVKRLGDDASPPNGVEIWLSIKKYPALLALYVSGIAAVSNRNYGFLRRLFALKIRTNLNQPEQSVSEVVTPWETLERRLEQQYIPGRQHEATPLNNHIFEALRAPLGDYLPERNVYDQAFDWFEYLFALAHCDATSSDEGLNQGAGNAEWYIWAPVGRFAWNRRHADDHIQKLMAFESGGPYPEMVDGLVQAGMFGSYDRLRLLKQGYDSFIAKIRPQMRAW